jgi:hypothetical protein
MNSLHIQKPTQNHQRRTSSLPQFSNTGHLEALFTNKKLKAKVWIHRSPSLAGTASSRLLPKVIFTGYSSIQMPMVLPLLPALSRSVVWYYRLSGIGNDKNGVPSNIMTRLPGILRQELKSDCSPLVWKLWSLHHIMQQRVTLVLVTYRLQYDHITPSVGAS